MAGKKGGNTAALVYEMAKPIADSLNLKIWDVAFEKEGAMWYLRVLIERADGAVDMDDCEAMTRPLSEALDKADPIEQSYMLEVGSPGLGRQLRRPEHFAEYLECPVRIRYIRETDGEKEFIAVLKGYNKDSISVVTEKGDREIKLSDTAFVKLYDDDELDN
ncbi:MAG: ribosome maturation factor RimP [Ruminococcus sp.]|nr:ribosome maturation factor RimP [Ruminococcus sp.]MCM1380961.1 ribosome maturation factor RimP [Muribaculaceae bacterium]MCM1478624.1 ribosome maturation factor RimP [Muribaculaceae bacterium]